VYAEPLVAGTEVRGGAERVGADEDPAIVPPESDFVPAAVPPDVDEAERQDGVARNDVMRYA
jgi:hypothetical protein